MVKVMQDSLSPNEKVSCRGVLISLVFLRPSEQKGQPCDIPGLHRGNSAVGVSPWLGSSLLAVP